MLISLLILSSSSGTEPVPITRGRPSESLHRRVHYNLRSIAFATTLQLQRLSEWHFPGLGSRSSKNLGPFFLVQQDHLPYNYMQLPFHRSRGLDYPMSRVLHAYSPIAASLPTPGNPEEKLMWALRDAEPTRTELLCSAMEYLGVVTFGRPMRELFRSTTAFKCALRMVPVIWVNLSCADIDRRGLCLRHISFATFAPPISFMFRYPDQQFGIGCYLHDILFLPSLLFTSCVGFLGGGRTLFDFRCARSLWTSESLSSSQERCHIFLSSNQQCPNFLATIFNEFTSFFYVVCRY